MEIKQHENRGMRWLQRQAVPVIYSPAIDFRVSFLFLWWIAGDSFDFPWHCSGSIVLVKLQLSMRPFYLSFLICWFWICFCCGRQCRVSCGPSYFWDSPGLFRYSYKIIEQSFTSGWPRCRGWAPDSCNKTFRCGRAASPRDGCCCYGYYCTSGRKKKRPDAGWRKWGSSGGGCCGTEPRSRPPGRVALSEGKPFAVWWRNPTGSQNAGYPRNTFLSNKIYWLILESSDSCDAWK